MFEPNTIVGRHYRIVSQLGSGGMSQVYKAVDVNLGREVALKFLHPESVGEKDLVQRFLNEGRILATIKHRAVIDVYASDTDEATKAPFLVMELVDGLTLEAAEHTLRGDLPRLLQLFIELLEGIHACHQKGIIHRDLKPANVLINRSGQLKIVDFGVAKTARKVTRTGVTLGTPHYMAPEQCLGKADITAAADIYSIGIMFWEMLAGKVPFDIDSGATDPALSIALKHLNEPVPIDRINDDPRTAPFADLLHKMLAKKPEDRPTVPDIIETLKKRMKAPAPGMATTASDPATIGDIYRLERVLGQGGMGTVYKALDTALNRPVAIKVLNASISTDETVVDRFIKEGQLLATVGHPNVLAIYASSRDKATGRPFLVMEYIDGMLLSEIKKSGVPEHRRIVPLMLQLLDGIRACHMKGIIHRDLKPSNLMVTRDGTLKIFDFGIAKTEAAMTRVGMTLGTPQYMSPEQCTSGSALTPASDVYSIGIVLWEMIFGSPPFTADNDSNPELSIALKQVQGTLPMPSLPADPALAALVPMIRRMLDKQPGERPTTDEIISLLDEHLQKYPVDGVRIDLTKRRDSLRRSAAEGLFAEKDSSPIFKLAGAAAVVLVASLVFWQYSRTRSSIVHQDDRADRIASLALYIPSDIHIPATPAADIPSVATSVVSVSEHPVPASEPAPLPASEPAIAEVPVETPPLPVEASDTIVVTLPATETVESIASPPAPASASVVAPEPPSASVSAPVEVVTASPSVFPPVAQPPQQPVAQTTHGTLDAHFEAVRKEIDEFNGEDDPSKIQGKLDALGILAGSDQVGPLKRQLASKIALAGDMKLVSDKNAAVAMYERSLTIDPDQPATKAKIGLAREALDAEKAASTKKAQQAKEKDRAGLLASAEKDTKAFKPGFSAPRPLIGRLKALDTLGENDRVKELTAEIRDKYLKAATERAEKDPAGALRLLKQVTGFPGLKNDGDVKSLLDDISLKAKSVESAAAKPSKPVPADASDSPGESLEQSPGETDSVPVPTSEAGALLSQITQPEVVGHNVEKIIQLCRDLEKKRRKDEAAAYRLQAVENLVDNAEENSANGAFDAAIADYNKALKILPSHPGALTGKRIIENLSKKGSAAPGPTHDEAPEPYIDAQPDDGSTAEGEE
ncbi:serine/threonine protein kinase [Candidatus Ozemobacteraceae bacterium]|nr:serine/threonine protein kinase [Candidatus Ozemobacteraceae bacterium]